MTILGDSSVDEQVKAALVAVDDDEPTVEQLVAAANLEYGPSPVMLEATAQWLAVVERLQAGGLTHAQITRAMIRATTRAYDRLGPTSELISSLLAAEPVALARELADELLAQRSLPHPLLQVAHAALVRLAADGAIEPRDEALFRWSPSELPGLRAIFASLPVERRVSLAIENTQPKVAANINPARNAAYLADVLLSISDLLDAADRSALSAHLDTLLALAITDGEHARMAAEVASGTKRIVEDRPTEAAKSSLAYVLKSRRKKDLVAQLPERAEAGYARKLVLDAPELATTSSWNAAGPARREQIVNALVTTLAAYTKHACTLVAVAPVAILDCAGERFCVVPGGTFEMGMSDLEEELLRDQVDPQMFEDLVRAARPVTTVRVGPMLVAQGPGTISNVEDVAEQLAISPFRVPTEAEWEYCARGGAQLLTYRGNDLPDANWFHAALDDGVKSANAFGLWGFGIAPELCADRFMPTLDGIPTDGSPRTGIGVRSSRGGAAQLYPWQGTGEWQLLLTPTRVSSDMWEYALGVRWVLGIDCAEHTN